jgi:hypothetical protein
MNRVLSQSIPDRRGDGGHPVSPSRRARESRGQQIDSGRLNAPPAAKVPRRIPDSGIAARLTEHSRIVPIDARCRVAVQSTLKVPVYCDTGDGSTGPKPTSTAHRQALAHAAGVTIMEPPGPAATRGKP